MRAEPQRFKESGVKEVVSKTLLSLWNIYRLFNEQTVLCKDTTGHAFAARSLDRTGFKFMDRWTLADCQNMLRFIHEEMRCRLSAIVPHSDTEKSGM